MKINFTAWSYHFRQSTNQKLNIDFSLDNDLEANELSRIWKALQLFEKGENSEGKHLIQKSRNMDAIVPDTNYGDALRYFIKEEQTHSFYLREFMRHHHIPLLKEHWLDKAFRWMRNLAGLELSIHVLVTAEFIAAVFYKVLKMNTSSQQLKTICDRILADEQYHIIFQSLALKVFADRRSYLLNTLIYILRTILLTGTCTLLYVQQRTLFRYAKKNFSWFLRNALKELKFSNAIMQWEHAFDIQPQIDIKYEAHLI